MARQDLLVQVEDKFLVDAGCWSWTAYRNRDGYGKLKRDGKSHFAHRVLYEELVGPVPDGAELDHSCRNRACVRPDHVRPVTHRQNVLDGESLQAKNARKTRCPRGHEYDKRYGQNRRCSICDNARKRLTRRSESIG